MSALKSKKVILNISHGEDTGGLCLSDATLYPSDIADSCSSLSNLKFILLESCWSSAPAWRIYALGASCTLGFGDTITAGTHTRLESITDPVVLWSMVEIPLFIKKG